MVKLTQEEKNAIRDEAVAKWWKEWHVADYSWCGLEKKEWRGWVFVEDEDAFNAYIEEHGLPSGCPNEACGVIPSNKVESLPENTLTRKAHLQDYWRDQQSALLGQKGHTKQYTIAHLPQYYENGKASLKHEFSHNIWERISFLIAERISFSSVTGNEHYDTDMRAQLSGCVLKSFTESIDPENELHLNLSGAALFGHQLTIPMRFGSSVDFSNALLAGYQGCFIKAKFKGGNANFKGAMFSEQDAYFSDSEFSGGSADFSEAQFIGGDVFFTRAKFSGGYASFEKVKFPVGRVYFVSTDFSGGHANFSDAEFPGEDTRFSFAKFSSGASFNKSNFSGGMANFNATIFGGSAHFEEADLSNGFNFHNSQFESNVYFEDTIFPPASSTQSAFLYAEFSGVTVFSMSKIARTDKGIDLENLLNFPFNAFDHVKITDRIVLSEHGEEPSQAQFDAALTSIEVACAADKGDEFEQRNLREQRYVALEYGCTTIKRALDDMSDKNRAQRFFKFELLARQRRPSTRWTIRQMTKLYGIIADYGGSITRPLWTLLITWVLFGIFYSLIAYSNGIVLTEQPFDNLWGPLRFSVSNMLRPFSSLTQKFTEADTSWLGLYMQDLTSGRLLAIQLVSILQSLLSITLLFLFGLATKRKFQIG